MKNYKRVFNRGPLIKRVGRLEGVRIYESVILGYGYGSAGLSLPGIGIIVGVGAFSGKLDPWLVKHELGHFLQARLMGLLGFYGYIALPSLASAILCRWGLSNTPHQKYWTETWANSLSHDYFNKPVEWPLHRFPIA